MKANYPKAARHCKHIANIPSKKLTRADTSRLICANNKGHMAVKKYLAAAVLGVLVFSAAEDSFADSFKVGGNGGVAQILQNGKPVRPRMFWGTMGGAMGEEISAEWKNLSFDFTSPIDDNNAALHLRMGEQSGGVWVADLKVEDLTAGETVREFSGYPEKDWSYWCEGWQSSPPLSVSAETADGGRENALHISMTADPKLNGFHMIWQNLPVKKSHSYRVSMRAKADAPRLFRPAVYIPKRGFMLIGALNSSLEPQTKLAKKSGLDFVSMHLGGIWTKPGGEPDYSEITAAFGRILSANPEAKIIPRIFVQPPDWWKNAHPEELMKTDDGETLYTASIASEKYLHDGAEAIRLFIKYCEENYPDNMAGYHIADGNTGEWFYQNSWSMKLNGYDEPTLKAWRKWLKNKYASDAALKKSWNDESASIRGAEVPAPAERRGTHADALIDPQTKKRAADFAQFMQDAMADAILHFAKTTRETAGKDRLVLFFYGYGFEFSMLYNGPHASGHYALGRILESPYIDVLCGPISYHDRQLGGGKTTMGATESVQLAGKVWLDEDDTATYIAMKHHTGFPGCEAGAKDLGETVELLRRNLAQEICRNIASWWMDLGGTGWFDDPELWKQMDIFAGMESEMLAHPSAFKPDIAIIYDERSMCHVGGEGSVYSTVAPLVAKSRDALNKTGAPYGHYLLSDILKKRATPKLNAFLAVYALDKKQRKQMREVAKNSACIWGWAPAYIDLDKDRFSVEAVEEATGFKVRALENSSLAVTATEGGKKIGLPENFGDANIINPALSPIPEDGDVVLATYKDSSPAIVLRPGKFPQLFCGTTEIPPALYRHMMKLSGVHSYTAQNAAVYANGPFVALCAADDGEYEIDFAHGGEIWDVLESKPFGKGPIQKVQLKKGETKVWRLKE